MTMSASSAFCGRQDEVVDGRGLPFAHSSEGSEQDLCLRSCPILKDELAVGGLVVERVCHTPAVLLCLS